MATVTSKKEAPVAKATLVKETVVKAPVVKAPLAKTPAVKKTPVKKAAAQVEAKAAVEKPGSKASSVAKSTVKKVAITKPEITKSVPEHTEKVKKAKLVRDSFTMPESEYAVLGQVKRACLKAGVEVKKSQLLRIGLALLNKTDVPALKKLIADLAPLKAGRPKKEK
ncbi:hypothetical protein [Undibacterium sp. SXout20W]|uniref:hypothetical protein n=1 Tax=Undibacterium sp. SXout20W TaxID=3413051 RepID=UPI003BF06C3E